MIALAAEWGVTRAADIVEEVVNATGGFATTARRLKVRHPGSLRKVCTDVRRRTGLLSALSGGPRSSQRAAAPVMNAGDDRREIVTPPN